MGSLLIIVPDLSDAELVLDEIETRGVLKMFWPQLAGDIDDLAIGNGAKRLAQSALVAAIDGSYAMGFIEGAFRTYLRPASSVSSAIKRVAKFSAKHWWKHATAQDLADAKIYNSVRDSLARNLRRRMDELILGLASQRRSIALFA